MSYADYGYKRENNGFTDIALAKFEKGEISLEKLESMAETSEEIAMRNSHPDNDNAGRGIRAALDILKSK